VNWLLCHSVVYRIILVTNHTHCELCLIIRFLSTKNIFPIEIHRQPVKEHGEGVMNEANVRKWCNLMGEGQFAQWSVIRIPVCHHRGFEGQNWCSHQWKEAIHYWWASRSFSTCFAICPLRDCHSSTPIQKNLCQMNSEKSHRWTQAEMHGCCSVVFGMLPQRRWIILEPYRHSRWDLSLTLRTKELSSSLKNSFMPPLWQKKSTKIQTDTSNCKNHG
jgi:hypothetical protein